MDQTESERTKQNTNSNIVPNNFKCRDDISMMMAWQNWCWMNYSLSLYHKTILQLHSVQMFDYIRQNGVAQNVTSASFSSTQQQRQSWSQQPQQLPNQQRIIVPRVRVKLASIQKRIAAEAIDFFLLAFIKVLVIFFCYGEQYLDNFNFILVIDDTTSLEDVQLMLVQALLFRVVVVAYEGYMLSGTLPFSHGHTLGKSIMGITAVYCLNVEERDEAEQTAMITPEPLGVGRSCLRSLLKNMSISILFPMLLPILMFSHNRLVYDLAVGSIVIERQNRNRQEERNRFDFR